LKKRTKKLLFAALDGAESEEFANRLRTASLPAL
jgi:hypothetical protein